jgi:Glycosyl transferase family 2
MKLIMTLLARDEADVIDAQVAFHLNAGVDFVIAMDNLSQDGTGDVLESYAREGHLHLIRERGEYLRQADWITQMGRLAATDFGADWVIHSDADEFWWPRGASLKDVLGCERCCGSSFLDRTMGRSSLTAWWCAFRRRHQSTTRGACSDRT